MVVLQLELGNDVRRGSPTEAFLAVLQVSISVPELNTPCPFPAALRKGPPDTNSCTPAKDGKR